MMLVSLQTLGKLLMIARGCRKFSWLSREHKLNRCSLGAVLIGMVLAHWGALLTGPFAVLSALFGFPMLIWGVLRSLHINRRLEDIECAQQSNQQTPQS